MAQNGKKKTRPGAKKAGDANVDVNANGTATASRGGVPFAAAPEGAVATRSAKKKQGSKKSSASSSSSSSTRATSRGRGHASGGKGGGSARARSVSKSLHPRRSSAVTAEYTYEELVADLAVLEEKTEKADKQRAEGEAHAQAEYKRIANREEMLDHVLTHTSLEEKVDALKEDVDGLKEEYQAYKQETKQQVDDLQSQIDNLQSQLDARQRSRVAKILAAVVYWVMRPIFGI
mmetsp:Transcript_14060/g.33586  ORF Transcript_14060/g.33586 Transcript_14060/m.33586 type:complete len:233 (+) Transcript_14060:108-806(+)